MSGKKPTLSPDEKALFQDAAKDVKLLRHDKQKPQPKQRQPIRRAEQPPQDSPRRPQPLPPSLSLLDNISPEDWLSAEDRLHFVRGGIQHRIIQRMQRGQVDLEARLDLHRLTMDEAAESVTQFIDSCITQGIRWVCIIHGKGHYSKEGKPILKNFINQWLRTHPSVLAFHSAKPKDGGTGALYVLLKRGSRHEK